MKRIAFLVFTASLILTGCPKHEIIPKPTVKVDLKARFAGQINSTDVEWTDGVNGYSLVDNTELVVKKSPDTSFATYAVSMQSTDAELPKLEIRLGKLAWDAGSTSTPTLALFTDFFKTNVTPTYQLGGNNGFEVIYTDETGRLWKSNPAEIGSNKVEFFNLSQESDASGDYMKFKCQFSCNVFRVPKTANDTIIATKPILDAEFTGWFKR